MKNLFMKHSLVSALFLHFFAPGVQVKAQTPTGVSAAQLDSVVKYAGAFPKGTQLAIALAQNDQVSFLGLIREGDTLRNIDNHQSVFGIGSITKVFTSTLLVQCVADGIVRLDAPVQEYFDFPLKMPEKGGAPLTLKTLANHTSGLPRLSPDLLAMALSNMENPYKSYGAAELKKELAEKITLYTKPGEKYHYSNLGAGLLGFILAQQSGKTFDQLLEERIFKPYQMSRSCVDLSDLKGVAVPGLNANGDTTSYWEFDALKGAGAILSTVEDLSKFMLANFREDSLLAFQRQTTFSASETMDVALGWHILKPKAGGVYYWHDGGTGGFSSNMVMDVGRKNGVIVLSNVSAFHPKMGNVEQICFRLMKVLE